MEDNQDWLFSGVGHIPYLPNALVLHMNVHNLSYFLDSDLNIDIISLTCILLGAERS